MYSEAAMATTCSSAGPVWTSSTEGPATTRGARSEPVPHRRDRTHQGGQDGMALVYPSRGCVSQWSRLASCGHKLAPGVVTWWVAHAHQAAGARLGRLGSPAAPGRQVGGDGPVATAKSQLVHQVPEGSIVA